MIVLIYTLCMCVHVVYVLDSVSMQLRGPCEWVTESNRQISPYQSEGGVGK